MHFSYQIIFLASLATGAWAAPAALKCRSSTLSTALTATPTTTAATDVASPTEVAAAVNPTLPSTGSTDLPGASANMTLKYIAVGHGIQNYTCANANATAASAGALAVLWDVTPLYPGTEGTGLTTDAFDGLTSTVLWDHAIPLNLQDPGAAGPPPADAGRTAVTTFTEANYQADASAPYPSPAADLALAGVSAAYLGVHYFDAALAPTFDLAASTEGLFFSGAKVGDVKAPADADKGLLATSAVDWLELGDNGRGLSRGLASVYRVVTAGGAAEACSVSGANAEGEVLSVPYVAQYWFYG